MTTPTWPWTASNLRPPDRRHRAAVERSAFTAAEGTAEEADGSDPLIHLATRYYTILRGADSRAARRQCAARMPVMGAVHRLRFEQHDLREIVELRLLAGVDPLMIGFTSEIDPRVVSLYHDLHFDVASRLNRVDYMLGCVLRPHESGTDAEAQRRWSLRLLAWLGGEDVVERLICPVPRRDAVQGQRPRSTGAMLTDVTQSVHQQELALALLAARFDHRRTGQLADRFATMAIKRAEPAGDPGQRDYIENVRAFLDHVTLTTGPLDHVPPERRKYCDGPVEPNAQEWAALARGEPVPTLDAKIEMSARARHERELRLIPPPGR